MLNNIYTYILIKIIDNEIIDGSIDELIDYEKNIPQFNAIVTKEISFNQNKTDHASQVLQC